MHVIAKKKLRKFWRHHRDAKNWLENWERVVTRTSWKRFADVKAVYASADLVGRCTVFDVKGNKYRLVVIIDFEGQRIYVRDVMTHAEYDKNAWKGYCNGYR